MKKLIDGVLVDMTSAEVTARESEEEQAVINRQAIIDKQTEKKNNRTSGKAKLKAGESLTDAEISALFGDN